MKLQNSTQYGAEYNTIKARYKSELKEKQGVVTLFQGPNPTLVMAVLRKNHKLTNQKGVEKWLFWLSFRLLPQ
jgi:hypothetical protein